MLKSSKMENSELEEAIPETREAKVKLVEAEKNNERELEISTLNHLYDEKKCLVPLPPLTARYFRYSCCIIKGRTRRNFRANLFRFADIYGGYTRENTPADGIAKDGENINISLIFETRRELNRFESEVIELISVMSGYKRPLIDEDESIYPNEIILSNHRTDQISIANNITLLRVYKHHYDHDSSGSDPENSAECDGYSDVSSISSTSSTSFGEPVNINDPEKRVQMIEDPRSSIWNTMCPEAVRIKDRAKCSKQEKDDANNFIYMSIALHCYFVGLNSRPAHFPCMKIQYVGHDEEMVPCPVIGTDPNPLGLPRRQRVTVRIIFWDAIVKKFAMIFIREGGVTIDELTYQIDLYFLDANKAMMFLQWKEAQTEKVWVARRRGVSPTAFADSEQICQNDLDDERT